MSAIDDKIAAHNTDSAAHDDILDLIGDVTQLTTEEKGDCVSAITELCDSERTIQNGVDAANREVIAGTDSQKISALETAVSDLNTAIAAKTNQITSSTELADYAGIIDDISTEQEFQIHFGANAPADTTKLWIKKEMEPDLVRIMTTDYGYLLTPLTDMSVPNAHYVGYGYPVFYNGKVYVKSQNGNTSSKLQAFDTKAGTWTTLTDYAVSGYTSCGFVRIGDLLYGVFVYTGGSAQIMFCAYNPAANTWGSAKAFSIASVYCAVCALNNLIYVAYVASTVDDVKTWKLKVYNPSNNTLSADLNFSVNTTAASSGCALVSTLSAMYFIASNEIYVYDPAANTTGQLDDLPYALLYRQSCDSFCGKIIMMLNITAENKRWIGMYDLPTHTMSYIEIPLNESIYLMSIDDQGLIYIFGHMRYVDGDYLYNGHTYVVNPKSKLTENTLAIVAGNHTIKNAAKFLNTSSHRIEMQVKDVYYGNADDLPVRVTAACFDGTTWKEIN